MEQTVHFVRHGPTQMQEGIPPARWRLSAEGEQAVEGFARRLTHYLAASSCPSPHVFSSPEPKALQTASPISTYLGCQTIVLSGLEEHHRPDPARLSDPWETKITQLFTHPDELVLGTETARRAYERFRDAVNNALARCRGRNLIIVSHGTVLALFLADGDPERALHIWKSLRMPDCIRYHPGSRHWTPVALDSTQAD